MKNELRHISIKYGWVNNDNASILHDLKDIESRKSLEKFVEFIPHLKSYNSPDMYAKIGNEVLFIEHFEFDSAKNIRKGGSLQKHEEVRIDKKFSDIVSKSEKNEVIVHDEIISNSSFENYKNNFEKAFDYHLSRIPEYMNRLKDDEILLKKDKLKKAFFIEDTSALGNYIYDREGKMIYLNLLYSDILWEYIEKNDVGLDYILFGLYNGKENIVYFIDLKSKYEYRECYNAVNETTFITMTPKAISYSVRIPEGVEIR